MEQRNLSESGVEKSKRTITTIYEWGAGPIDYALLVDHAYVLSVKRNTPIEEIKLPTMWGVRTTTADEQYDDLWVWELIPDATMKFIPITWRGDREYTPDKNSIVIYTAVLPEGYVLANDVSMLQIHVMVDNVLNGTMANTRTTPLDLTANSISYIDTTGSTKSADPSKVSITDTGEGWSWDFPNQMLILNGATIDCSNNAVTDDKIAGLHLPATTTVHLSADSVNTVIGGDSNLLSYGILIENQKNCRVDFEGEGVLNVTGGNIVRHPESPSKKPFSVGICSMSVYTKIKSGTIKATGGTIDGMGISFGVMCPCSICVEGGTLIATGGVTEGHSYGMTFGTIDIKGGMVIAKGGAVSGIRSSSVGMIVQGLKNASTIDLATATVTAVGGTVNGTTSAENYGVLARGELQIYNSLVGTPGGSFQAIGTIANAPDCTSGGIKALHDNIQIGCGNVTLRGETLAFYGTRHLVIRGETRMGGCSKIVDEPFEASPSNVSHAGTIFCSYCVEYGPYEGAHTYGVTSLIFKSSSSLRHTEELMGTTKRTTRLDLILAESTNNVSEGWTWDKSTNTLTLFGATITCTLNENVCLRRRVTAFGLRLPDNATIVLQKGTTSTITGPQVTYPMLGFSSSGILCCGLKIKGEGKLIVSGGKAPNSLGLNGFLSSQVPHIPYITISGSVQVIANGGEISLEGGQSRGIGSTQGYQSLKIEDQASVTAIGGNSNVPSCYSAGICGHILELSGKAKLVSNGGSVPASLFSKGIYATACCFYGDGIISAQGADYAFEVLKGVNAPGAIVTGAKELFVNGAKTILTQANQNVPVSFSFPPSIIPSITIGTQSTAVIYGTVTSPTYTVTATDFGGNNPAFAPRVEWAGAKPIGVTESFSADNTTLTIITATNTKAGEYMFKVASAKVNGGNYESNVATLVVDKRIANITFPRTVNLTYNESIQAPIATLSNKVGQDDVTVKVIGGAINVGSGYIATADALEGTDAVNYIMPSQKPTKTFSIKKADYLGTQAAAPNASTANITNSSVSFVAQTIPGETVEYGYSTNNTPPTTWQDSPNFTGLSGMTQYYFFARVKTSTNYEEGVISAGTAITTFK